MYSRAVVVELLTVKQLSTRAQVQIDPCVIFIISLRFFFAQLFQGWVSTDFQICQLITQPDDTQPDDKFH